MSESNNKEEANDIDASSFASILAGVKRMREEYGGDDETAETQPSRTIIESRQPQPPQPVFPLIQSQPATSTISSTRTTLMETTAEPIRPRQSPTPPAARATTEPVRSATGPTQSRSLAPSEILVNKSQTGNPLLKDSMMKLTPHKFDSSILSDYYISATFQILFLSLKYYKLRPEYIWTRLKKLNKGTSVLILSGNRADNALRILLVVVDIDSHQEVIRKLLDFCIKHDLSMVLAWSFEEAGNYIAMAKQLDNAPAKSRQNIKGVRGVNFTSSVVEAFTGIRLVNKTDVSNMMANCKSVKNMVLESCRDDSENGLGNIPGFGPSKLKNLRSVFLEPFIYNKQYEDLEDVAE